MDIFSAESTILLATPKFPIDLLIDRPEFGIRCIQNLRWQTVAELDRADFYPFQAFPFQTFQGAVDLRWRPGKSTTLTKLLKQRCKVFSINLHCLVKQGLTTVSLFLALVKLRTVGLV